MSKKKLSFDLELSNSIFKADLASLILVSKHALEGQKNEYEMLSKSMRNGTKIQDWSNLSSHYSNIDWLLLNSMLLASFSFFEHHLFSLCRIIEDQRKLKIELDDIAGKGIYKYSNYLYLVGNLSSADKSKHHWQILLKYQKVRNIIAHNGAIMVSDTSKKLEEHECFQFLKSNKVIMAGTVGHIRIREISFLEQLSKLASEVSDKITTEIIHKKGIIG